MEPDKIAQPTPVVTIETPVTASQNPIVPPAPTPVSPKPASKFNLNPQALKEKFNQLPKNTKTMVTVVAVLLTILFILAILSALFGKKPNMTGATPSPSPVSVTPIPNVILNASRYATDSGVLKIEDDLNGFQNQLNTSDVKQTDLALPNIDFNINFNH